jgi:AraC-like DNA-binding protein
MILNYIQLLVFEGMKGGLPSPPTSKSDAAARITREFLQLLQSQFPIQSPGRPMQLLKPGDFARHLSMHVNHLNATVRNSTGQTTTQHIAAAKIAEAKALLRHSDHPISAIAECLGFDYAHHFNRFFKRNTASTPAAYRTKRIL